MDPGEVNIPPPVQNTNNSNPAVAPDQRESVECREAFSALQINSKQQATQCWNSSIFAESAETTLFESDEQHVAHCVFSKPKTVLHSAQNQPRVRQVADRQVPDSQIKASNQLNSTLFLTSKQHFWPNAGPESKSPIPSRKSSRNFTTRLGKSHSLHSTAENSTKSKSSPLTCLFRSSRPILLPKSQLKLVLQ